MLKQTLSVLAVLCCLLTNATSQTIYVKEGGAGTGTSWLNATGDLQYALAKATSGTEIWVATGTYYPTDCKTCTPADRAVAFVIPNNVKLLGGFAGTETRENQRNWRKNPVTLSGNIGGQGDFDNSYSVIYTKNVGNETVVDGFIIADGNANADATPGHPSRSGGAWYNDGAGFGNDASPFIMNCVFLDNQALEGAGLFNNGDNGKSSPVIVDCIFSGNKARYGGGALFNHGQGGESQPTVQGCQFVNNMAAFGAGVFTACSEDLDPLVERCSFVNNKAQVGSGLFYLGIGYEPLLRNSRFLNNQSKEGEDVFVMKGKMMPEKLLAGINRGGTKGM